MFEQASAELLVNVCLQARLLLRNLVPLTLLRLLLLLPLRLPRLPRRQQLQLTPPPPPLLAMPIASAAAGAAPPMALARRATAGRTSHDGVGEGGAGEGGRRGGLGARGDIRAGSHAGGGNLCGAMPAARRGHAPARQQLGVGLRRLVHRHATRAAGMRALLRAAPNNSETHQRCGELKGALLFPLPLLQFPFPLNRRLLRVNSLGC